MNMDREIINQIEEAKQHQDFRLEKILLQFTGTVCARMEQLGINKAELAKRLDSSRAFVTKVLKCNHNITLKTMDSIAHALDMELNFHIYEIKSIAEEMATNTAKMTNVYKFERPLKSVPIGNSIPMLSNGTPVWVSGSVQKVFCQGIPSEKKDESENEYGTNDELVLAANGLPY